MHHFTDRAGRGLTLPVNGGVFLGDGLRTTLPVRVGDAVTVPATGLQVTEPVAAFLDEPMAAVAYLERTPRNPCPHPRKHRRAPRLATGVDPHTVGHRLTSLPGAAIYVDNAVTESTIAEVLRHHGHPRGAHAFAVIMAAALLFNAMSANVAERAVELGTLQAAGLSRTTVTRIASAENLLLALPVGLVTGTIVARWFMSRYQNLGYRWTLEMRTSTYFIVTGGLLLAALATQLPLRRAIHHIDIARIVRERSI